MLGRQQIYIEIPDTTPEYEDLIEIMANGHLNNHFLNLAREVSNNKCFVVHIRHQFFFSFCGN